jgi:hypothetical protein
LRARAGSLRFSSGDAPQIEQDFVAVGVGAQAVAEEGLRLGNLAHALPEPVGGGGVGLDFLRVQRGGGAEPRQDFTHVRAVAKFDFLDRMMVVFMSVGMGMSVALVEVRVLGGPELAPEGFEPVARRAEEIVLVAGVLLLDGSGVGSHVRRLEGGAVVEDARVIAAVEVSVGLDEEVLGEELAAIADEHGQQVAGAGAIALPALRPALEAAAQAEADHE